MLWSRNAVRAGLVGLALLLPLALAGCSSLQPVYGDNGIGAERLALSYAKPTTRLEQIIYQDLALSFGKASSGPLLTVVTSTSNRRLTRSDVSRPSTQREAVVSADIEVKGADGTVLFAGKRSAAASYSVDGQGLADTEAVRNAEEQAARALAETIRLTLIGVLAR
jgi:LPS-assembly lipoprotein